MERLVFLLSGYDPSVVKFLFVGFREGFAIHCDGLHESSDAKNLILALENPVMPLLRMLFTILRPLVDVFLAKTDIKSAFQIIPVRPQDYNL